MALAGDVKFTDYGVAGSAMTRVSDILGTADMREESKRVALNIVRRIDEVSQSVAEGPLTGDRAEVLVALTRALDALVDIARRS